MSQRGNKTLWQLWLLISALLFSGGCIAPDGSIIRLQQDPNGMIISWQIEGPTETMAQDATAPPDSEQGIRESIRPILYTELTESRVSIHAVDRDGAVLDTWENALLVGWSPQGNRFAYLSQNEATQASQLVIVVPGEENKTTFEFNPEDDVYISTRSSWSPDGTQIACVASSDVGTQVLLIDAVSGTLTREPIVPVIDDTTLPWPTFFDFAKWSPDAQKLLLGGGEVAVLTLSDESADLLLNFVEGLAFGMGYLRHREIYWLPKSDGVIYVHYQYQGPSAPELAEIMIEHFGEEPTQLLTNEQLVALGLGQETLLSIRLSPTGTYLAVADQHSENLEGGHLVIFDFAELMRTHNAGTAMMKPIAEWELPYHAAALEWSPDETSIAFLMLSDSGGTVEVLQLSEKASQTVAEVSINSEIYAGNWLWLWNLVSWMP